jgi:hypothetical protein
MQLLARVLLALLLATSPALAAGDLSNSSIYSETDASNNTGSDPGWPEGMAPSRVNDAARALQGALKRDWDRRGPTVTSGGTANAQTLTYSVAPTAYVQGDSYCFIVGASLTNTSSVTLNVNGLGAKAVTKLGTTALQGGELVAGAVACVQYDGTQFQLLTGDPQAADLTFWGGTSAGTANAQTVSLTPAPGAYVAGMHVVFKAGNTNTGAATLNVNSLGTKNIFVAAAALTGGEIVSGNLVELVYDGTQFQLISPQGTQHGALIGFQKFETPGTSTYTPTAGTNSVVVIVVGSGGGGGGTPITDGTHAACAGGGGGGGWAINRFTSSFSGVTVTVGAKGAGATAGNNAGTSGNSSSFGALLSATGGTGGTPGGGGVTTFPNSSTPQGNSNGGVGSSGAPNFTGGYGGYGYLMSITVGNSGGGGFSYGGAGASGKVSSGAGFAASAKGSGGGGALAFPSQAAAAGGDGADGAVYVWEYN